ncbi:ATP-binding protein [Candidatus Micrarchaeota archaeon]|nr:ATP-binding protein [Candidatus Micrarchaeota archaeon]
MDRSNFDQLRLLSVSLSKNISAFHNRKVYEELLASINRKPRIKLVKGFRGLGKTTALLQLFAKNIDTSFYFSADHPIAKEFGIYVLSKEAIRNGFKLLLIDEIHTYPKWREEVKALYDEFPELIIVASGSAPLALNPERREEVIEVNPMDLGEFINITKSNQLVSRDEWKDKQSSINFIASSPGLETDFYKYFRYGAFPSSIELDEERALNAIYHSIRKSMREDGVFFLNLSKEKIFGMENLILSLATSSPGELSITSLSNSLSLSKTVIYEIIAALEGMGIIRIIRPYKKGFALVRAEPKMLFTHPNFRFAVCKQLGRSADSGAIREELAVFGFINRGFSVNTIKGMKKSPDYIVEKGNERFVVEIGGERKNRLQLKGFENGLVLSEYQLVPLSIL